MTSENGHSGIEASVITSTAPIIKIISALSIDTPKWKS